MAAEEVGRARLPGAADLVLRARERLAAEIGALPPWESPLLRARLRAVGPHGVSLGALGHYLRAASRAGDVALARELFTLLLRRIEATNRAWAAAAVRRTPELRGAEAEAARDDLQQELVLRLWSELGRGGEAWELFFSRALAYAQRHTATAYMRQRGLWGREGIARPTRALPWLLSRLATEGEAAEGDGSAVAPPDPADHFSAAELADLRALVRTLPERERLVVVMRHWQQATEDEIAAALGVTGRTVRNYLRAAYARLRAGYGEVEG